MSQKTSVMLGMTVGSIAGGYIPLLWGAGMLSYTSVIFSALGGIAGIYISFKMTS